MFDSCEIFFNKNDAAVFFSGDLVTGTAILKLDKPKEVKGVTLHITGHAKTSWEESDGMNSKISLGGHVYYLKLKTYLQGDPESSNFTIPAGIHNYTFDFQLPHECPTSFESEDGWIRYEVKISLERPWRLNKNFNKTFSVIKPVNLNLESPILKLPANGTAEKVFCCGPCQSEPLLLDVTLPRTGFVPGEIIPIQAIITNDSNRNIIGIKVSLMKLILCMENGSKYNSKRKREVTSIDCEGILRYTKKMFNYQLLVPSTPPTSVKACEIIEITYEVHVEAKIKGPNANQVLDIPVVIGTVPMRTVVVEQPTTSKVALE